MFTIIVDVNIIVDIYLTIYWFISRSGLVIPEGLSEVMSLSHSDKLAKSNEMQDWSKFYK